MSPPLEFQWPEISSDERDRRTGLAVHSYLVKLARLFDATPDLVGRDVEIAFLDLAGFGRINARSGSNAGDRCLRAFAQGLAQITDAIAVREGGDEFVVVGAPDQGQPATGAPSLVDHLEVFRSAWPTAFRAGFDGDPFPAARILVTRAPAVSLLSVINDLGFRMGDLKRQFPELPDDGVLVRVGDND